MAQNETSNPKEIKFDIRLSEIHRRILKEAMTLWIGNNDAMTPNLTPEQEQEEQDIFDEAKLLDGMIESLPMNGYTTGQDMINDFTA